VVEESGGSGTMGRRIVSLVDQLCELIDNSFVTFDA
jgi:hypothetical protein